MKLPVSLMNSLANINGFDKETFEAVHSSGSQVTSIRINPLKSSTADLFHDSRLSKGVLSDAFDERVPWSEYGYYLNQRPSFTFDPLFHAGCYYVQEASSMFLEQALNQTVDLSKRLKILDLAAAPGGKSTHIQSLISKDSLLVSNEVIKSRAKILKDNIVKWGYDNAVVTNNDPKDFSKLENYFDVIVVDAPCSGSGLFRRDHDAINEWSPNNVQLCSQRQRRILADVWPALKKDGVLIYATCSYSKEEDEDIIDWMSSNLKIQSLKLQVRSEWKISESSCGYRFWPDKVKGEGFFIACVKKHDGGDQFDYKTKNKFEFLDKKEIEIAKQWVKQINYRFFKIGNEVHVAPENLLNDLNVLFTRVRCTYSGIIAGELMGNKLIPGHSLAMSNAQSDFIERIELEYDDAIAYLKKQEVKNIAVKNKGWNLAVYRNHPLGWINVLPTRINNYYPKELRILKDI